MAFPNRERVACVTVGCLEHHRNGNAVINVMLATLLMPLTRASLRSAVPDERQEQQRAASKDDVVEQVKAQADAESMRQLKQRIAQNLSDAAVEQEPERVQTRQATTDTSTRRQSFQRRDEIEDIKAQVLYGCEHWRRCELGDLKIAPRGGGGGVTWTPAEGGGGGWRNGVPCRALCFV